MKQGLCCSVLCLCVSKPLHWGQLLGCLASAGEQAGALTISDAFCGVSDEAFGLRLSKGPLALELRGKHFPLQRLGGSAAVCMQQQRGVRVFR